MATSDKMNYDANQNTYCQINLEAISECRGRISKLERDLAECPAASNGSKADVNQASMRKGIVGQMLNAQDCQGSITIESHTQLLQCLEDGNF